MKHLFNLGVLLAMIFVGLCVYWYYNPSSAPAFWRGEGPQLKLTAPDSPMKNFRPPRF